MRAQDEENQRLTAAANARTTGQEMRAHSAQYEDSKRLTTELAAEKRLAELEDGPPRKKPRAGSDSANKGTTEAAKSNA